MSKFKVKIIKNSQQSRSSSSEDRAQSACDVLEQDKKKKVVHNITAIDVNANLSVTTPDISTFDTEDTENIYDATYPDETGSDNDLNAKQPSSDMDSDIDDEIYVAPPINEQRVSISISKNSKRTNDLASAAFLSRRQENASEIISRLNTKNPIFRPNNIRVVKKPAEVAPGASDKKNIVTKNKSSSAPSPTTPQTRQFSSSPLDPLSQKPSYRKPKRKNKSTQASSPSDFKISTNMMLNSSEFLRQEDDRKIYRRPKRKSFAQIKKEKQIKQAMADYPTSISAELPIEISSLAKKLKRKTSALISWGIQNGESINKTTVLSDPTIIELICMSFNCKVVIQSATNYSQMFASTVEEDVLKAPSETILERSPVVVIMGHVDHGKTSLIDFYKQQSQAGIKSIVSSEAGSITQNIGAFEISSSIGEVTIIDTPGHAAFSEMRQRGASVADICIIAISGEEGIKDQTIEGLTATKNAGIPIVVAATKSDTPNFNIEKIYSDLSRHDIVSEAWGGDCKIIPCSSYNGNGMDELLNALSFEGKKLGLEYSPAADVRGRIVLSTRHKNIGIVTTIIIKNGNLNTGDIIATPTGFCKIKQIKTCNGKVIKCLTPSAPAEVIGFNEIPISGEEFKKVSSIKEARNFCEACRIIKKQHTDSIAKTNSTAAILDSLNNVAKDSKKSVLIPIIIKSTSLCALAATTKILTDIKFKNTELNIAYSSIGPISQNDVDNAKDMNAIILSFQCGFVSESVKTYAIKNKIQFLIEDIIYRLYDYIKETAKSRALKESVIEHQATLEILVVFKSSKTGKIAGCRVVSGTINRNHIISVVRSGKTLAEKESILSMRTEKDNIKESRKGSECGIVLKDFHDFVPGDILESYSEKFIEAEA